VCANCHSLAVSKLVTTKERKLASHISRGVAHVHDASQLLIANDKYLEILPAKKVSISINVLESSHTRK